MSKINLLVKLCTRGEGGRERRTNAQSFLHNYFTHLLTISKSIIRDLPKKKATNNVWGFIFLTKPSCGCLRSALHSLPVPRPAWHGTVWQGVARIGAGCSGPSWASSGRTPTPVHNPVPRVLRQTRAHTHNHPYINVNVV